MTPTHTLSDLTQELRLGDLKGDPWGTSLAALFDVAAELWWRGVSIPGHWDYSPGAGSDPREPDSYFAVLAADTSDVVLIKFGNLLERYTALCRRYGKDY